MSHEPNNPPPVAKSPASRRKSVTAPQQDPPGNQTKPHALSASKDFIHAHETAFKAPSGEARFEIKLSAKAAAWRYEAATSIGKPFGFDPPNASMRTTDVTIHACIPPDWFITTSPWREALARAKNTAIKLCIGAEAAEPPAPAEAAWTVHLVIHSFHAEGYGGIYQKRLLLSLGQHSLLVTFEATNPAAEFIEHIRQVSIKRLQGPEPSIDDWAASLLGEPWLNTFKP